MAGPLEIEVKVTGVGIEAIDLARTVLRAGVDPDLALAAGRELAHAVLLAAEEALQDMPVAPAPTPFSFEIEPPPPETKNVEPPAPTGA